MTIGITKALQPIYRVKWLNMRKIRSPRWSKVTRTFGYRVGKLLLYSASGTAPRHTPAHRIDHRPSVGATASRDAR
jgi:hypothetical protein